MRRLLTYCLGLTVFFAASCSKDAIIDNPEQAVPSSWTFGFNKNQGNIDTVGNYVVATNQPLQLSFFNLDSILSAYGDDASFKWTLSNDQIFESMNPEISVDKPGDYQLKLEITDKDGHSHLIGQRKFKVSDRQFLKLTIGKNWGWYGIYLFNDVSWPDTQKADVYLRVLDYDNVDDQLHNQNPKIIFKSAILKGVSPAETPTLTILPKDEFTPFPFDLTTNANYVHQLIAVDGKGKEYIWLSTKASGLAIGPSLDIHYNNGSIQNGEIHFTVDGAVSIYFGIKN